MEQPSRLVLFCGPHIQEGILFRKGTIKQKWATARMNGEEETVSNKFLTQVSSIKRQGNEAFLQAPRSITVLPPL